MKSMWLYVLFTCLFCHKSSVDTLCLEGETPYSTICTCNNVTASVVCTSTEMSTYANITDIMLIGIKSLTIHAGSTEVFNALGALQKEHEVMSYIDIEHTEGNVTLDHTIFGHFPNITHLRLHHCGVNGITPDAFIGTRNLEVLDLSGNSYLMFNNLTESVRLASILHLKVLNISGIHNAAPYPEAIISSEFCSTFRSSKLEVLDLSWIFATEMRCSFAVFPHLRILNISGTDIDGTKPCLSTLLTLQNVETFALDHWPTISRGYESIAYTPESEYIQDRDVPVTESNSVKKRETTETSVDGVAKRDFGEECVFTLPYNLSTGCFLQPKAVKTIYVRHTDLDRLFWDFTKETCFQDSELINFLLTGFKSTKQVQRFYSFHSLKFIDMAYPKPSFDGLPFVSTIFQDMPRLEINFVPGARLNLLAANQLVGLVKNNKRLRIIDISDNNLERIPPDMFVFHHNLEILNVSRNKLSVINTDFSNNNNLQAIDLRYNIFVEINDPFVRSIFTSNETRHLRLIMNGNNLKCNCNLLKVAQLRHVTTFASCFHDGQMFDLSRISTSYSQVYPNLDVVCQEETESVLGYAIGGSVGLVIVIIIVVVGILLHRRGVCFRKENPTWIVTLSQTQRKREPTFIVFLAYCSNDSDFVLRSLYPKLEEKLRALLKEHDANKLVVIHDKHFLPGMPISDIIYKAIEES